MRVAPARSAERMDLQKKLTYLLDSVFAFTDLPIRLLALCRIVGLFSALDTASPSPSCGCWTSLTSPAMLRLLLPSRFLDR